MDALKKILGTPLGSRNTSPSNGSPADGSSHGNFVTVPSTQGPEDNSSQGLDERRRSTRLSRSTKSAKKDDDDP